MCVYSSYSCDFDHGFMFWKQSEYLTVNWPQDSEHQPTPKVCISILPLTKFSTHQILFLFLFSYLPVYFLFPHLLSVCNTEHKSHFQSIKQANKKEWHCITVDFRAVCSSQKKSKKQSLVLSSTGVAPGSGTANRVTYQSKTQPSYSCHDHGNKLQRPKPFSVPDCQHVYFCWEVGHFNTGSYGDWLTFETSFERPLEAVLRTLCGLGVSCSLWILVTCAGKKTVKLSQGPFFFFLIKWFGRIGV